MGEIYNPYPKLPKNIRQIGERDQVVKLYVEDYVNTYLKRLYPIGGQALRVGLLVGEIRKQDGQPYLFVDGALEMEGVSREGEKVEFTEHDWKRAYEAMEQMFPRRTVLGWFLCGAQGSSLSPLNYWRQHSQYFAGKYQLMYLNCGLEGDEALYIASEEGFYKLQGYCIYYERNQMMQDYMVSRKDAHRVETGTRDAVIRDFRQKMENKREETVRTRSAVNALGTACGVLALMVLAGGVTMFNNYQKMRDMEAVIASALPEGTRNGWSDALTIGRGNGEQYIEGEVEVERVPGGVYLSTEGGQEIIIETGEAIQAGSTAFAEEEEGAAALPSREINGTLGTEEATLAAQEQMNAQAETAASAQTPEASQEETVAQPVQIPADAVLHVVENGETLYSICMENYNSMKQIKEICLWNGLEDENRLSVGQEIYIPAAEKTE